MKTFKYVNHLSSIKIFILMFLLGITSLSNLNAQTNTVLSGNWNDPANWDNGVPFASSPATVSHDMILNSFITIGKDESLIINNSGSLIDPVGGTAYSIIVQMQGPGGVFEVNGKVEIEGSLIIQQNGTLYVRSNDTLIVGDAFFWHDAVIVVEEFGVMIVNGDLEMKQKNTTQLDGNLYVNGNITATQQSEINGTGKVQATGTIDLGGSSVFFGNTNPCDPGPCEYGTGSGLPVEMISFKATHTENGKVNINWITASEINNDYFILEKSNDGLRFEEVARKQGQGTISSFQKYSVTTNADPFVTYYRITQVDYNGASKIYNPVALAPSITHRSNEFRIYPNPAKGNDQLTLDINSPSDFIEMEIRDLNGKTIVQETDYSRAKNIQLDDRFKSGVYMVTIINISDRFTEKLIITK